MVNRQDEQLIYSWIAANAIGAALGIFIGYNMSPYFGLPRALLSNAVFCLSIGATISLAQWLVLRQRIRANLLWLLLSTVGWSVGFDTNFFLFFAICVYLSDITNSTIINSSIVTPIALAILGVVWGLLIGALGWLILIFQVRFAYRWLRVHLWAISVSFGIAGTGYYGFQRTNDNFLDSIISCFFMGLFGLIYGSITAPVLVKLLQHPRTLTGRE